MNPTETTPRLILASTSPYRRAQMARLGLPFQAVAPRFEEQIDSGTEPAQLAIQLAEGKAMSVAADFDDAIVIGSDQVVWFSGRVLAKPGSQQRAFEELRQLRGQRHEFFMGLFLYHTKRRETQRSVVTGSASLRADLTDEEIWRYVTSDDPVDCAGSAKIEGPGIKLFEALDCVDWNAIVGLPVIALCTALRKWNVPLF